MYTLLKSTQLKEHCSFWQNTNFDTSSKFSSKIVIYIILKYYHDYFINAFNYIHTLIIPEKS